MRKEVFFSKPSLPPIEDYYSMVDKIWSTKSLATFGPIHSMFEKSLSTYLESENLIVFSNGHTALESIIGALNLNGEIITTPFTFISTANAITRNGAEPVFCDIDDNMTIDAEKIENLISSKTSAILGVHILGNVCDIPKLSLISKKYSIPVIYDGAHAFGVKINGESVSKFGVATMFSFHASKVFNSAEGGAVTCNDMTLYQNIKKYRYYGMENGDVNILGLNGKMNELSAALGLCNLKYIEKMIIYRKNLVEHYRKRLSYVDGIFFRKDDENIRYNYIYFFIFVDELLYGKTADELCTFLNLNGIHAKRCFPQLISSMEYYSKFKRNKLDNSNYYLKHLIILPLHTDMSIEDVDYICDVIIRYSEE